jgi:hypothetical protein
MIKNITTDTTWIQQQNSYHSVPPMSPGAQSAGILRWNTNTNTIEVYNGMSWYTIDTSVSLDLSEQAKQTLSWAYDKMIEERKLKELLARHPGLKELNDKFEMMKVLCQEEEKHK